eukprot:TRINITY_DN30707_c0_g1_i1.p1 TRINITY_DN30707_c0_g1~~TRINITY_DN30707_c0_g1_i1.p1  ORF type:complete len:287 (-),score=37.21 TRINITY_DN30707_c0_g1_i1:101-961(-)
MASSNDTSEQLMGEDEDNSNESKLLGAHSKGEPSGEKDTAVSAGAESGAETATPMTDSCTASNNATPTTDTDIPMAADPSATSSVADLKASDLLNWNQLTKDASRGWQKFALAKSVFVALWSPAVLMTNTVWSRWLPAMAMAHTFLVLAMAWHAYMRMLHLHAPGSRVVALANRTPRKGPPPVGAWLRLLWACTIAAVVIGTHLGAMTAHYDTRKCLKSVKCWRAWILTLGFVIGSISLAIQYVYAEWVFLRTGIRISHFLYTPTAFLVDERLEQQQEKKQAGKTD